MPKSVHNSALAKLLRNTPVTATGEDVIAKLMKQAADVIDLQEEYIESLEDQLSEYLPDYNHG